MNVRVDGQLVFNSSGALLHAALQGLGLAYLTEGQVQPYLSSGELIRVLGELVPAILRISPILSEPSAAIAGIHAAGRRASIPRQSIAGVKLWLRLRCAFGPQLASNSPGVAERRSAHDARHLEIPT
ncbi:DNA-binding transcriptional LysR family regulator [Bradyrhizobium sp. S3.14.4]